MRLTSSTVRCVYDRTFHIHAQEIIVARGALDDGKHQPLAEFGAQIQTELRQLAGNVGLQFFLCDAVEDFQISVASALRIGRSGNILAQIVEAREHPSVVALARGSNRFVQRFAGYETPRHAPRGIVGGNPAGKSRAIGELEERRPEHGTLRLCPRAICAARSTLIVVLFQELFRVHGGHAPGTRGGDGLPVAMILHIAGDENAGNLRQAAVFGDQIAVRVHFQLALEHLGVGIVPDGHEESVDRNLSRLAGFRIAHPHALDRTILGNDFIHHGGCDELDFFIGPARGRS